MALSHRRALLRMLYSVRAFSATDLKDDLRKRIEGYIASAPVVVFMKGTQKEPLCGFSRNVKMTIIRRAPVSTSIFAILSSGSCILASTADKVLDFHEVKFKDYNVLEDNDLREGIKKFSDWPTIPQVFVNGNFVGGCDIMVQMHQEGEITDFFKKEGIKSRFSDSQQ
ncbi:unnamed protein product [Toxocara canis]|uniref:Glutaredoxin domain-containing protein n=1 Tax=Toxocara canis TaxID=6265 RepID=A0A183V2A4_TOXCA|nr:unnamed protein product [Toxocara canis]